MSRKRCLVIQVLFGAFCAMLAGAADRESGGSARESSGPERVWVEPISGIELVYIPAGSFVMGTPEGEDGREVGEALHPVVLTRPFYMGRFEVTQKQWQAVMGTQPSHFSECGANCPVEGEATFRGAPTPVGSFAPTPWGLYDMHGNVWEWCLDWHCSYAEGPAQDPIGDCDSGLRVIRGGSWYYGSDSARCGLRYTHSPGDSGPSLGFRVVREIPLSQEGEAAPK